MENDNDKTLSLINQTYSKLYRDNIKFAKYRKVIVNGCEYTVAYHTQTTNLNNYCYKVLGNNTEAISIPLFVLSSQDHEKNGILLQLHSHPEHDFDFGIKKGHNPAKTSLSLNSPEAPLASIHLNSFIDVSNPSEIGTLLNKFINREQTLDIPDRANLKIKQLRYADYAKKIKDVLALATGEAALNQEAKSHPRHRSLKFTRRGFPHKIDR